MAITSAICNSFKVEILKGPMEMLTLYENKYKSSLQTFAAMQIGRRRRDDYTDGTIRLPIESAPQ